MSTSSGNKQTTVLGILTGVSLAAVWIGISIYLREPAVVPEENSSEDSRREAVFSPHDIRPSLVRFRDQKDISSRGLSDLLRALPEDLSPAEVNLLLEWLTTTQPESEFAVGTHAYLVNEVLLLLHRQEKQPDQLPATVIALTSDESQPDLVRDYALQHLRTVWSRAESGEIRQKVESCLWDAVGNSHQTRSGTALLALHNLGFKDGLVATGERAVPDGEFKETLEKILAKKNAFPASRMTALRILRERSLSDSLASVRDLLATPDESLAVRLSAIATLGGLGDQSDRELLASLSAEPILETAVASALSKLAAR